MDATLTPFAERLARLAADWLPALLDATLKGTLLLALAGVATTWGMRRAAAATRHLVWSAAVVAVLALPLLGRVVPGWTAAVVPPALVRAVEALRGDAGDAAHLGSPSRAPRRLERAHVEHAAHAPVLAGHDDEVTVGAALAAGATALREGEPAPAATPQPAIAPTSPTAVASAPGAAADDHAPVVAAAPAGGIGWGGALFGVWAAGVGVALLRLALGTFGLARLVRRAQPADDPAWVMPLQRLARELGIRRPVSLYVGRTGTVPVTWGVVYPVVLLPADAAEWSAERRRAVLLHELAHVERLDALTQVVAQLAGAVFWFNPLVALAGRRLRAERERACDDLVLAAGGVPATRYADDLLDLVRTLGEASPAAAALAMARRSEFEGRLLAILDPAAPRARTDRRRALVAAALVGVAAVPLAGMRAAPAAGASAAVESTVSAVEPFAAPVVGAAPQEEPATPAAPLAATAPLTGAVTHLDDARARLDDARARLDDARTQLAARLDATTTSLGACSAAEDGRFEFVWRASATTGCLEMRRTGTVTYTPAFDDVRVIADGGVLVLLETRDGVTRRMELAPQGGRLVRRYTVNGVERPAGEGEAWFRETLRDVVRRAELDREVHPPAAPAADADPDFSAMLQAVRRTASDGEKRRLLLGAVERNTLSPAQLWKVALVARGIASDGDKSAVLEAVAKVAPRTGAVASAVVGASRGIASDGDRRRVLERTIAPELPAAVVVDLLRAVSGMTSDGDKAAVLLRLAQRAGETPELRDAFFGALRGFTSDGDRKRVLLAALDRPADDSTVAAALGALRGMVSDGDRAEVLKAAAAKGHMGSAPVRERYFKTAQSLVSETSREAAVLAALRAQPSHAETQAAAIAASTTFVSDTRRANVLLEVARTTDALRDPARRARFVESLRGMTSSSEYRRVMEAVMPAAPPAP